MFRHHLLLRFYYTNNHGNWRDFNSTILLLLLKKKKTTNLFIQFVAFIFWFWKIKFFYYKCFYYCLYIINPFNLHKFYCNYKHVSIKETYTFKCVQVLYHNLCLYNLHCFCIYVYLYKILLWEIKKKKMMVQK